MDPEKLSFHDPPAETEKLVPKEQLVRTFTALVVSKRKKDDFLGPVVTAVP